jgi:hypothetical protein
VTHNEIQELATPAQWRAWTAVEEHGSITAAAAALGHDRRGLARSYRTLEAKLAAKGHHPRISPGLVPEGQRLRGISTCVDGGGNTTLQWVKTEKEDGANEAMSTILETLRQDVKPLPAIQRPRLYNGDLLVGYPIGDHHIGMLAWRKENGGESWDVKLAQQTLDQATDFLVDSAPQAGHALVAFLGDFMHYDSWEAVTPSSGNVLDADGRYPKMVRAALESACRVIERAAEKHRNVTVIVEIGNHDLAGSVFLAEALRLYYAKSEHITIVDSPAHYHHHVFGNNLIATHHGHGAKMADLPQLMATDWPLAWGNTVHRVWWTGHIHHTQIHEYAGATVESFRVLAPKDGWHHQRGYRSRRGAQAIVFHALHGEIARNTVHPEMFQ